MVAGHDLCVARRRSPTVAGPCLSSVGSALLLLLVLVVLGWCCCACRVGPALRGSRSVVHGTLRPGLWLGEALLLLRRLAGNKHVDAPLLCTRDRLVVVVVGRLGVFRDYVPSVEEAGDL
jgi:hypothetical protein